MKKHIIKVLANGHEVPYPHEVVYKDALLLKDYRLNRFPMNLQGEPKLDIPYEDYLEWLQQYLYECSFEILENQRIMRDLILSDDGFTGLGLGWETGFYESQTACRPYYDFPDDFEKNINIDNLKGYIDEDPYLSYLDFLKETDSTEELLQTKLEFVLEDYGWFLLRRQEEYDFAWFWQGFSKMTPIDWIAGCSSNTELPDFGWRPYLSFILKKKIEKSERIKELDMFFKEYSDTIHK